MKGAMNGTEMIITFDVFKAWPIADGALGAIVYTLELVMIWMASMDCWRTMPWMVPGLVILILPLGVVSIYFIIIQPIVIGTWCPLCLIAALAIPRGRSGIRMRVGTGTSFRHGRIHQHQHSLTGASL